MNEENLVPELKETPYQTILLGKNLEIGYGTPKVGITKKNKVNRAADKRAKAARKLQRRIAKKNTRRPTGSKRRR